MSTPHKQTKRLHLPTILKRNDVRGGIQCATGFFILLAVLSPPVVWNALTLANASISPVYAIVSFSIVMQANLGTSLSYVSQRLAAATLAGVLGIICMYVTYAANGLSYEESTTKSAVMTVISPFFGFCLALSAYRWHHFWFGFIVAGLCLPIVAMSAFHLDYVEVKSMPYFLMQVVIGVTVGAVVPMFVLPNTAGRTITATTSNSLKLLGEATKELVELLLPENEGGNGSGAAAACSNGETRITIDDVEGKTGINFAAQPNGGLNGTSTSTASATKQFRPSSSAASSAASSTHVVPPEGLTAFIESYTNPVSAALVKAKALLVPVTTEFAIYRRPHIFPKYAYGTLLGLLRHYLSTLMTLTYLAEGDAPLDAARTLRKSIIPVAEQMQKCFSAAAAVLARESGASYAAGIEELTKLEAALHKISTIKVPFADPGNMTDTEKKDDKAFSEGEIVMADTLIAVIFALGSRLRRLYFVLPEAISRDEDPNAWDAWRKHFKGQKWDFEMPGSPPVSPLALQQPAIEARSPLTPSRMARLSGSNSTSPEFPASPLWRLRNSPSPSPRGRFPTTRTPAMTPASAEVSVGLPSTARYRQALIAQSGLSETRGKTPRFFPPGRTPQKRNTTGGPELKKVKSFVPPPINAFPPAVDCAMDEADLVMSPRSAEKASVFTKSVFAVKAFFLKVYRKWQAIPSVPNMTLPFGISGESFVLSLQVAVALAGATLVHVCTPSYEALNKNTIWCVVTVAVMAQKSVGGVMLRAVNRIMGTVAAAVTGLGVLYFVYLCNGLSYENHAPKFIAMTVAMSLLSGLLMFGSIRSPHHFIYTWTVWKFTLAIVALVGYSKEEMQPKTALWRLVNISLGLAIDLAATTLVFPVSTEGAVKRRICKVLYDLADISAGTSTKLLRSRSTSEPPTSPFLRKLSIGLTSAGPWSPQMPELSTGDGGLGFGAGPVPSPPRSRSPSPGTKLQRSSLRTAPSSRSNATVTSGGGNRVAVQSPRVYTPEAAIAAYQAAYEAATGGPTAPPQPQQYGAGAASTSSSSFPVQNVEPSLFPTFPLATELSAASPTSDAGAPQQPPLPPPPPTLGVSPFSSYNLPSRDEDTLSVGSPQIAETEPLPALNLHIRTNRQIALSSNNTENASSSPVKFFGRKSGFSGTASGTDDAETPKMHKEALSTAPAAAAAAAAAAGSASTGPTPQRSPLQAMQSLGPGQSPTSASFFVASPSAHRSAFHKQRTRWVKQVAIGRQVQELRPLGKDAAALLAALAELEMIMEFEEKAFNFSWLCSCFFNKSKKKENKTLKYSKSTLDIIQEVGHTKKKIMAADIKSVRKSLRRMLNALLSFSYVIDGPDVPHLRLLSPFRPDIDAVMVQMSECLRAVAGVASGKLSLERLLATETNLRTEVQELLLEVEKSQPPWGCTQADVVLGFAALGVLVAAVQTLAEVSDSVVMLCMGPEVDQIFEDEEAVAAGALVIDEESGMVPPHVGSYVRTDTGANLHPIPSKKELRWTASAQVLLGGPSMVDLVEVGGGDGSGGEGGGSDEIDEDKEIAMAQLGHGE